MTPSATKLTFGASSTSIGNSEFADIKLDELKITGTVKTDGDILSDYNSVSEYTLSKTTTYEYDSDDYLNKITKPDGSILTYTYDANKRLIKRKVEGTNPAETTYLYDGDKVISETTGTDITKYLYDTAGNLLIIVKNNISYYPVYDGLGSIVGIRDSAGTTINSYNYDEWGVVTSKTEGIQNPLRFASYRWDNDAQMYLLGARWYDPTIARFVSVDPHPGDQDDALSQNEYVYCGNNPINNTDPDGDKWGKVAAGLAIGVGVALCFTGVGGFAGAVLIGAASGALIDGGSAYLNGARGKSLAKATGKGALIGGITGGIGWGVGKVLEKGAGALASRNIKITEDIRIERGGIRPDKGRGFKGVPKVGHINIGKVHIIKPSTAKKLFNSGIRKAIFRGK